MKKLLLVSAAALLLPGLARAGLVTVVARDVPLGPRSLQAAQAPIRFDMLGLHWRGSGTVEFRTRAVHGGWGAWQTADSDQANGAGWHLGNVAWVGASDRVQLRTAGVSRVRAFYLWSKVTTTPRRTLSIAGSPAIVPRSAWLADEKIVRAKPQYAAVLKLAIVHHTASTNAYTPAEAAAIVRGIEAYHVQGNGWNDIGYNFVVDRYGTIYEGRGGGIDKNVIGAHSLGFNTGTVGVTLLGNFAHATPPPAMQAALVNLLSWRLDVAHVDPLSSVVYTSSGNPKFRAGKVVTLHAISAHRDTGFTECPGNAAYALLPAWAQRVSLTGLPKIYSPVVSGALGGPVRFQGRLSSPRPWTVTVDDASGATVAQGTGRSATIDWTWDAAAAAGPYTWTIDAGAAVRPASGTLGAGPVAPAPPPSVGSISALTSSAAVVSPNPDGTGGYVTVGFTLGVASPVTVQLTGATAAPLTLFSGRLPSGPSSLSFDLGAVPDGRYLIAVDASGATQSVSLVVDRTLTAFAVTPALVSPNGDGVADTASFTFNLSQPVYVQLVVQQPGASALTLFAGTLGPGPQYIPWDGFVNGVRVPDGVYQAVVLVNGPAGNASFSAPLTIDTTPPVLTLLDQATLRFQLSEPAVVTLTVNGQSIVRPEPAGIFTVPWQGGPVTSVVAQADDAAGNLSR